MTLTYQYGDNLYINLTNRCTCACTFCIRTEGDAVGDGGSLWLEHEPEAGQVISDLAKRDLNAYGEAVFCGYGEPTESLGVMLEVCRWLRKNAPGLRIRLNTNGLCDLSHKKPVAPLLEGLIDTVSISLNAPDAKKYLSLTNSVFGEESFGAMLKFAEDCKKHVPRVAFSVVDVLTGEEIERCRKLADSMGIPLRVRQMA